VEGLIKVNANGKRVACTAYFFSRENDNLNYSSIRRRKPVCCFYFRGASAHTALGAATAFALAPARNFPNFPRAPTPARYVSRPVGVFSRSSTWGAGPKPVVSRKPRVSRTFGDHMFGRPCTAPYPYLSFAPFVEKKNQRRQRGHDFYYRFSLVTETTYTVWTWTIWKGSRPPDGRPPKKRCSCAWWKAKASTTVTTTSKYSCPPANGCSRAVPERFRRSARGERSVTLFRYRYIPTGAYIYIYMNKTTCALAKLVWNSRHWDRFELTRRVGNGRI